MKDVIGFGALNLDLIYEIPDDVGAWHAMHLESGGEILGDINNFESVLKYLEIHGELICKSGGGQAANTISALSRMGFDTGYIGKVGTDEEGKFLIQGLEGVDTRGIVQGFSSGLCIALLNKTKSRKSFLILPNCNDTLSYDEIDIDFARDTRFMHITSFIGDIPFNAQKRLASELSSKVKISFDPNQIYAKKGLRGLIEIIRNSYIIFLTKKEIEFITNANKGYKDSARELLSLGPQIIVCKLGEEGSYILSNEEEIVMPADRVEVVDTVGAGDVYAAGFLGGLLLGRSLYDCALFGAKAAGLSISGYGRERYPDKEFLHGAHK
ncbi:MAG: carbohydrate kinase family protein [Nitrospinae bacterium]|nr:carbohydrate kinase family protein [Nitrospinota bacterium]